MSEETSESPVENLRTLQERFAALLGDLEHPPLGMAAALAEECGEVATCLLDHHAYAKPLDGTALAAELADVLVCLFEIATHHDLDLQTATVDKLADITKRVPGWQRELGDALRHARELGERGVH